jgi:hypothetical protein
MARRGDQAAVRERYQAARSKLVIRLQELRDTEALQTCEAILA